MDETKKLNITKVKETLIRLEELGYDFVFKSHSLSLQKKYLSKGWWIIYKDKNIIASAMNFEMAVDTALEDAKESEFNTTKDETKKD